MLLEVLNLVKETHRHIIPCSPVEWADLGVLTILAKAAVFRVIDGERRPQDF